MYELSGIINTHTLFEHLERLMWVILTVIGLPFHVPVMYVLVYWVKYDIFRIQTQIRFPMG